MDRWRHQSWPSESKDASTGTCDDDNDQDDAQDPQLHEAHKSTYQNVALIDRSPSIISKILLGPKFHRLKFYCLDPNEDNEEKWRLKPYCLSVVSLIADLETQPSICLLGQSRSLQNDAHPHFAGFIMKHVELIMC